ncbi:hypothetical protein [Acetivibrio sp. MSJd-27]|uniref:hypothetical protein n=1 Tax=Acetivibrio sp. MSJd-27 TaxID=2841523 RepID=UPI001C118595|nr:hypothetical protein [Acetivibrio sp. MSJd-27]MBU5449191.1 hypothetical protein [Acetivibrio sp. MSJd-27]
MPTSSRNRSSPLRRAKRDALCTLYDALARAGGYGIRPYVGGRGWNPSPTKGREMDYRKPSAFMSWHVMGVPRYNAYRKHGRRAPFGIGYRGKPGVGGSVKITFQSRRLGKYRSNAWFPIEGTKGVERVQTNPGKYGQIEKRLEELESLAREGLSDDAISARLGIGRSTFYRYKKSRPAFEQALERGRHSVDSEVEKALFKKATGYVQRVRKPVKLKEIEYENGKKVRESERLEIAEEEQYYPPDTNSALFWLKNRCPEKWRDKLEQETEAGNPLDHLKPEEALEEMKRSIAELPSELFRNMK